MKKIDEGKKIEAKYCPKCKDQIMVLLKSGDTEVYECKNCKFRVKKSN